MELVFQAVERLLEPIGFVREYRRFAQHFTRGRVRGNSSATLNELSAQFKKHADFDAGTITVDSVTVFASTLGRNGPTYEALAHAEFRSTEPTNPIV